MVDRRRVYVTRTLPGGAIDRLKREFAVEIWSEDRKPPRDVLTRMASASEGLLCTLEDTIDAELLSACPELRVVSNYAVGYNNVDVSAATARRIAVCNTPGVLTDATADLAFALILASARRLGEAERLLRANRWESWSPTLLLGASAHRATLGIVGLGAIGEAVARRAKGFDMTVLYCGNRKPERERELDVQWVESIESLLEQSDFVSLHVPLTEVTRHLIDARRLERMKPNAYLINTSRGGVVDQRALAEALRQGTIAGAGLDVFEDEPLPPGDPLRDLENVVLVPHIGSATAAARIGMADLAADNLTAVLRGMTPGSCVNPEVL